MFAHRLVVVGAFDLRRDSPPDSAPVYSLYLDRGGVSLRVRRRGVDQRVREFVHLVLVDRLVHRGSLHDAIDHCVHFLIDGVLPSQPRRRVSSSRVGILPRRPAAVKRLYLRRRVLLLRSLLARGPAARDGLYPYRGLFPGSHLGSSGSSAMRRLNHNRGVVLRRLHLDLQDQVVEELVDVHIVADVRLGRVRGGLR